MKDKALTFIQKNWLLILTVLIPVIIYGLQRDYYGLNINVINDISVIKVEEKFAEDLKIKFKYQDIKELNVVDIAIKNVGNKPIEPTEFYEPISFVSSGKIATQPIIISKNPKLLNPLFTVKNNELILKPMLFNSGDSFSFRIYIVDKKGEGTPLDVKGRIANVKSLEISKDIGFLGLINQNRYIVINIILMVVFVFAGTKVIFRLHRFGIAFPSKAFSDLKEEVKVRKEITNYVTNLGEKLRIKEHGHKANLFLFRLKIESVIRELIYKNGLGQSQRKYSIIASSELLAKNKIISKNVLSAIRDVIPLINREIHDSESYLTNDQFADLEQMCLTIIATLEFQGGSPCQMSGQVCPSCGKGILDVEPGEEGVSCPNCGAFYPAGHY